MASNALLRQIAALETDPEFMAGMGALPNPDHVLSKASLSQRIFREILSDPHVFAKVIDRRSGVFSQEWQVRAAGDEPQAGQAAELCQRALDRMTHHPEWPLSGSLVQIQEAVFFGYRGLEVLWEATADGLLPACLRDIPGRRLVHDGREWRILTKDDAVTGITIPPRKALIAAHMATSDNPYGEALLSRCYWPWMFKHSGLRWWVTMAEKYGLPWIIAKLGAAADETARRDMLDKLSAMVMDAVAVVPEGADIELKNQSGARSEVHESLIHLANAEISKVIVGQTLSTEVDGQGSYAAARIHGALRDEIVDGDRKLVAHTMSRLCAWICELHFGTAEYAPEFEFVDEAKPPLEWAQAVTTASQVLGEALPERWVFDRLGIGEEYREKKNA